MRPKVLSVIFFLLVLSFPIRVQAGYVLPYPSFMPGNKLYGISRIVDVIKGYWYFGNIAKVKYHMGLADKYLVEAKTLFEYRQYLLASDALIRSDLQVRQIMQYVGNAAKEGIDVSSLKETVRDAMEVHEIVLANMKSGLPSQFTWRPEKGAATNLPIADMIDHSLKLRHDVRYEATASAELPR